MLDKFQLTLRIKLNFRIYIFRKIDGNKIKQIHRTAHEFSQTIVKLIIHRIFFNGRRFNYSDKNH